MAEVKRIGATNRGKPTGIKMIEATNAKPSQRAPGNRIWSNSNSSTDFRLSAEAGISTGADVEADTRGFLSTSGAFEWVAAGRVSAAGTVTVAWHWGHVTDRPRNRSVAVMACWQDGHENLKFKGRQFGNGNWLSAQK